MGGSSEAAVVGCRIISTVDVLVVGGGPAGIGAAVGAAYHENLRVAIVDEGGCFGGAVPKSLITFAEGGVVCSGDQLLIKGVWQRIQDEMVRRGGAIPAHELIHSNKYYPFDRSRCEKDLQLTIFDPECFKLAADEILTSHPNIQPILYTRAVAPIMSGNRVTGVYVENREGRGAILAKRGCRSFCAQLAPNACQRAPTRRTVRGRSSSFSEPAGSVRSRRPTGLT